MTSLTSAVHGYIYKQFDYNYTQINVSIWSTRTCAMIHNWFACKNTFCYKQQLKVQTDNEILHNLEDQKKFAEALYLTVIPTDTSWCVKQEHASSYEKRIWLPWTPTEYAYGWFRYREFNAIIPLCPNYFITHLTQPSNTLHVATSLWLGKKVDSDAHY